MIQAPSRLRRHARWRTVGLLALATAVLRLPSLRALPVFGDEAIHLHWSQLIVDNPAVHAFLPADPKPPLHFWLMALFLPLFRDPVEAGRTVSLLFGALSTALVFGAARAIALRFPDAEEAGEGGADRTGKAAAVFAILCPFAAFYQRIALAESLFLCESLLAAALALRLAERSGGEDRSIGVVFGVVLGIAMLTRQNFSYALWALPFCAFACLPATRRSPPTVFARRLLTAAAVALLLWVPVLAQKPGFDWKTRVFHFSQFREPLPFGERLRQAARVAEWFWTSLTPSVALFSLAALAWLLIARRRRVLAFLLLWMAIVILPLLFFAGLLFPRYTFTAAAPLWIASGIFLADLGRRWQRLPPSLAARRLLSAAALACLFAWPVRDLALQIFRWQAQILVAEDRWQYVTGWPAGFATEQALAWMRARAAAGPLVLITPDVAGNPGDTVPVLLRADPDPHIARYSASHAVSGPILVSPPGAAGVFLLSNDLWEMKPPAPVPLPQGAPVYFLAPDPFLTRHGWRAAGVFFATANPGLSEAARFENPPGPSGSPTDSIVVFRVR